MIASCATKNLGQAFQPDVLENTCYSTQNVGQAFQPDVIENTEEMSGWKA
jgi:hypothetical protein